MSSANADKILFLLKTRGPTTAAALARSLRITTMGVRQHLARLAEEGLVEHADERLTVGRPKRYWRLTAKAESRFPDSHAHMTVEILGAVRTAFGERGIDKIIAVRERDTLAKYRSALRGTKNLAARVRKLAELRHEEGYMAESSTEPDGGFLLVENHCPVCAAARVCQGLCRSELQTFKEVLPGCSVERVDHILSGARRCAYRITPGSKSSRSTS